MKKISVIIVFLVFIFNGQIASAVADETIDPLKCFQFNQSLKYTDGFWNAKNEAIFEVQQALFSLGYTTDEPDGSFGMATLRAVTLFQRKNDILATGYVGEKTHSLLQSQFCTPKTIQETKEIVVY